MGWYGEHVLPVLMDGAMDTPHLRRIRARVTAGLAGEVVELGFGSGHNLTHLPTTVQRLIAVEPSGSSVRRADERIRVSAVPVEVVGLDAQRLPLPDASVDGALCTWSLCTIPDAVAAVREVRRVLRRGGRLHFAEHGLAPDASVRRWQARMNPLQRRLAGGCTLDRDIVALLQQGGMTVTQLDRYYADGQPKVLGAMYEGVAVAA